jgi:hypothetical protein
VPGGSYRPALCRLGLPFRVKKWIQVEIDCGTGTVESLMFDDVSLWGNPPPIDVPISLAERVDADTTPLPKD